MDPDLGTENASIDPKQQRVEPLTLSIVLNAEILTLSLTLNVEPLSLSWGYSTRSLKTVGSAQAYI